MCIRDRNRLKIDGGNFAFDYFQSFSDFTSGTLVTTDIPATAAEGESFVMNVIGKSYSSASPFNFTVQGYLYNSTIINYSGIKLDSTGLATIKIFENGGVLCFWWATVTYWNAFEVSVRGYNSARSNYNRVTNITNSTEPVGTKKVAVTLQSFLRADASATNSVDLRAPIFYDSNDTAYYGDFASTSVLNRLNYQQLRRNFASTVYTGTAGSRTVKTFSGVLVGGSAIGGNSAYTVIETTIPQGAYQMGGFTIKWFENYSSTNAKTSIEIAGYWNPVSNGGFVGFEYTTSNPNVQPTIRVGANASGNTVFILDHFSSSYTVIIARDLWLGYDIDAKVVNSTPVDLEGHLDIIEKIYTQIPVQS